MMREEAEHYPPYDFESNVGYPAPAHKLALARVRPERDPPAVVDLHGVALLARRAAGTGTAVHLRFAGAVPSRRCAAWTSTFPRCTPVRSTHARRAMAGVGADQWDLVSDCDGLDRAGAGEPRRHRQLLGRRARVRPHHRGRSATGSTATCSAPTRCAPTTTRRWWRRRSFRAPGAMEKPCAVSYGPVPGVGVLRAPVHRRARPRVGRRQLDRAGHHASTPSWSRRASAVVEPQLDMLVGSGAFGTPLEVPDDAEPADPAARSARPSSRGAERLTP